jgi:hypothetical protein
MMVWDEKDWMERTWGDGMDGFEEEVNVLEWFGCPKFGRGRKGCRNER